MDKRETHSRSEIEKRKAVKQKIESTRYERFKLNFRAKVKAVKYSSQEDKTEAMDGKPG